MNLRSESSKFKINQFRLINDKFGNKFPTIFPKKLNKSSKLVHIFDASTLNTNTNTNSQIESYLNENNQKILNINENINSPEIITKKFKNAFKALEQLILDDENNDNNNNEENIVDKNVPEDNNNKSDLDIKKTQNIPKLDFSDIFDKYNNSPVYIREIINNKKCFSNYIKEQQN